MSNKPAGMSLVVQTITRLTFGLILLYGFYLILQSHKGPGGGFAAGVVIALSLILLVLAFGREAVLKKVNQLNTLCLMSIAAIAFLCLQHFTKNIFSELALAMMVAAGLFAVFLTLVLFTKK